MEEGGEEVSENLTKKKILTLKLHQVSKQPEEADAQEQAGQDEEQGGRELCTSPRPDPSGLPRPDQHSWVGKNVQVNPTLDLKKQPYHTHARPLSCLYKKCIAQIHFDPPPFPPPSANSYSEAFFDRNQAVHEEPT